MKGVSDLISFILTTALTVTGVIMMTTLLVPAIERAKASGILNDAMQQLKIVDTLVQQVNSEGIGSQRTFNLKVTDGKFYVNSTSYSFDYSFTTRYSPLSNISSSQTGNITLYTTPTNTTGETTLHLKLFYYNYTRLNGTESFPKGEYTICIKKSIEDITNRISYIDIKSC